MDVQMRAGDRLLIESEFYNQPLEITAINPDRSVFVQLPEGGTLRVNNYDIKEYLPKAG